VAKKPHASAKIVEGSLYIIVVLAAEVGVCVWVLLRLAVSGAEKQRGKTSAATVSSSG
jgi:hypothetical protein